MGKNALRRRKKKIGLILHCLHCLFPYIRLPCQCVVLYLDLATFYVWLLEAQLTVVCKVAQKSIPRTLKGKVLKIPMKMNSEELVCWIYRSTSSHSTWYSTITAVAELSVMQSWSALLVEQLMEIWLKPGSVNFFLFWHGRAIPELKFYLHKITIDGS